MSGRSFAPFNSKAAALIRLIVWSALLYPPASGHADEPSAPLIEPPDLSAWGYGIPESTRIFFLSMGEHAAGGSSGEWAAYCGLLYQLEDYFGAEMAYIYQSCMSQQFLSSTAKTNWVHNYFGQSGLVLNRVDSPHKSVRVFDGLAPAVYKPA